MNLKEQIRKAFPYLPDSHFGRYHTDLHVKNFPGFREWLAENYRCHGNAVMFRSQLDMQLWWDIPFVEPKEQMMLFTIDYARGES